MKQTMPLSHFLAASASCGDGFCFNPRTTPIKSRITAFSAAGTALHHSGVPPFSTFNFRSSFFFMPAILPKEGGQIRATPEDFLKNLFTSLDIPVTHFRNVLSPWCYRSGNVQWTIEEIVVLLD
jgi:hypothetical protein